MKGRVHSRAVYFYVFGALLFLTGLTTAIAYADLGPMSNAAAIGIASAKALLVALYFMHLREESSLTWVFLTISFLFLGILFSFAFGDYLTRGWQNLPKGWE